MDRRTRLAKAREMNDCVIVWCPGRVACGEKGGQAVDAIWVHVAGVKQVGDDAGSFLIYADARETRV